MSSASSQSESGSTVPEFTPENISNQLGIRTQPAASLAELDGWEEIKSGLEEDRNWEELDGVGPATAETLEMISSPFTRSEPESVVEGPEPSVEPTTPESEVEDDDGEGSSEQTDNQEDGVEDEDQEQESAASEDTAAEDSDDEIALSEVESPPSVFEATIEKSRVAPYFDAVSQHVDEAKIRIDDDGLNIRAVDPANVQMVDGSLSSLAFESYNAEMGVIGVNLSRLNSILGNANKSDLVHFQLDPEVRKLTITIENLEFTMALIDPDSIRQEPELPDLSLDAKVIIEGSEFRDAIKAVNMVADHTLFSYDHGHAEIYGEGDTDDATIDLSDNDGVHDITAHDAGDSLFSLDYLKNFKKMVNKDTMVTVRVGDDFPMMVEFGLKDGHIQIDGMLAPRIQD
ncbi:DNA polymerase sliding clamp [Haloarcula marismortui ATCC 33799]|jgi:proliferating cell nuclear antigen|uniref:DNA polymerase sliding clamp n=1 Tax=Haloarcula marismortui ATCC 33799 TaxID=662475 RepID=M0K7V4_9EURY|nr:DNA polymerase sliding clamp [Haloarcula californiae ATCC 33799]